MMLRDWKLAFTSYDLVRKDFLSDRAYNYYAGVQVRQRVSEIHGNFL